MTRKSPDEDVGDMQCVGDNYSTMQIKNQVIQVQQVQTEMRQKIKELTYIVKL